MDTAPASLFSAHALSVFPATLNEASGSLLHAGADRTDNEPVVSDIEALGAGQNEPNDGAAQQSSSLGLALLLGGDKPSSSSRPVAPIIDTLLEAAHYRHQMRNLKHPFTYNYSMFEWRMQEAGQSSRCGDGGWGMSASRGTGKDCTYRISAAVHVPTPLSSWPALVWLLTLAGTQRPTQACLTSTGEAVLPPQRHPPQP